MESPGTHRKRHAQHRAHQLRRSHGGTPGLRHALESRCAAPLAERICGHRGAGCLAQAQLQGALCHSWPGMPSTGACGGLADAFNVVQPHSSLTVLTRPASGRCQCMPASATHSWSAAGMQLTHAIQSAAALQLHVICSAHQSAKAQAAVTRPKLAACACATCRRCQVLCAVKYGLHMPGGLAPQQPCTSGAAGQFVVLVAAGTKIVAAGVFEDTLMTSPPADSADPSPEVGGASVSVQGLPLISTCTVWRSQNAARPPPLGVQGFGPTAGQAHARAQGGCHTALGGGGHAERVAAWRCAWTAAPAAHCKSSCRRQLHWTLACCTCSYQRGPCQQPGPGTLAQPACQLSAREDAPDLKSRQGRACCGWKLLVRLARTMPRETLLVP